MEIEASESHWDDYLDGSRVSQRAMLRGIKNRMDVERRLCSFSCGVRARKASGGVFSGQNGGDKEDGIKDWSRVVRVETGPNQLCEYMQLGGILEDE